MKLLRLLTLAWLSHAVSSTPTGHGQALNLVVGNQKQSQRIPESFVSYSIEFAFWPDYAGNVSTPNLFSYQLLKNLQELQGSFPFVRVGGNTQDYALYDASLQTATKGVVIPSASPDYPRILSIGKSFFESYLTWPGVKYIHGFNLGKNGTEGRKSLLATAPLACKALGHGRLAYWELGNEPDLFKTSAQGPVRPKSYDEKRYVNEWINGTRAILRELQQACPSLATREQYRYIAPSFAGVKNSLDPIRTWDSGLDEDKSIDLISSHNYIDGATQPGVTLAGTLMNHTRTVSSIAAQLNESRLLSKYRLPFILGETNSLYNQGAPGLSDSFGAALWGLDFNLWCATNNIARVHMHQGLNYRYQAWQPRTTDKTAAGTKAPYYGQIAVAAMLGNLAKHSVKISNIAIDGEKQVAYAAYENGQLKRLAAINLEQYNYTISSDKKRPSKQYAFVIKSTCRGRTRARARIQRLMANGSNAITGVTFDGFSYNLELRGGRPVKLNNVTHGETTTLGRDSSLTVLVPDSSAAIIHLDCH